LLLGSSVPASAQSVTFTGAQITVPTSGLSHPYGVAVDGAGDVFIADQNNGRVVEVPAGGGAQVTVGSGLNQPTGVAVDGAGNVFIADNHNNRVVEVPASGGAQTTIGSGLYYPQAVAVDGAGDVFIADTFNSRMVEVPAGGGAQTTVPASGLLYPTGVAVDGAGDVFIADNNNSRVVEVPAGGGAQTTVGSGLSYAYGVAVDGAGDVFIADTNHSRVVEVPAGGGAQTTVGSGLNLPYGVAVDGAGDVFIADTYNNRVVEVQRVSVNFGSVNICPGEQTSPAPCSQTFTLNYNVAAATTFGTISIVTQGTPNLDFTLSSGTCTGTISAGSSCTVNVTFAPRAPGVRMGAVQLADDLGDLLVTTMVHGQGQGPAIAFEPGVQTTVSASGLNQLLGVAVDAAGNVFIADTYNSPARVVKVPASGGPQTTVGSGLCAPTGVAVDGAGNVFIADYCNYQVVEVPAGGGPQTIVPVSGLSRPHGVAVDGAGNVFITDYFNSRVVEVTPSGVQTTVPASGLSEPIAVAVDGAGDVFIADPLNNRVVEVPAGCTNAACQTTVGSGLVFPSGVAVDGAGDVFIGDYSNSRVVEVTPSGVQTTLPASGLSNPFGVAVDGAGDVFIGDRYNNRVVEVQRSQPPTLSFASTPVGSTSSDGPQSVTIQNIGNQPLNAIDPGLVVGGPNFLQVAGSGTPVDCTSTFSLSPGASCNLSISFEPQSIGKLTATATFIDNALNATASGQIVALQATATQGSQTIAFGTLSNQTLGSAPFTLSATASSGLAVSFASTTPVVCTVSGATVTLVVAGTCTIQATQAGNVNYGAATPVNQSFQVTGTVVPETVPGAPTIGTATAGNAQASVTFTAPASNGGSAITGYTVTSSPGGNTFAGTMSPVVVTGLTNGTAYTFTVTATNSVGTGAASAASNSVTPASVPAQNVTFAGSQTTVPTSGLSAPYGMAVDAAGDLFIADNGNNRVVELPARGGAQTTVPASGLNGPFGVAVDGAGDVFIADTYNNRVVEVPAGGGPQITVASGLYLPYGLAADGAGDVFIADTLNNRVVEVPAGGGPQIIVDSGLNEPFGVAVDGAGDVFIADSGNWQVVEVPAGGGPQITVGSGLQFPQFLAVDGAGNLFIEDKSYGWSNQIVEIPAGGGPQVIVGSGLSVPYGLATDGAGDVFISNEGSGQVVEVQRVAVNFGSVNVCPGEQTTPAPCSQTITLNYNVAATTIFGTISVVTQGTPNLDFTLSSGSSCTGTVSAGSSCTVNVTFAPLAPGAHMGAVQLADNLGNVLITTLVHGQGQGAAVAFGPGAQTSMGSGWNYPQGLAVDGAGNVFIADTNNSRVVKVPADSGAETTIGSGLDHPHGVAVDGAGDVFIADAFNNRVVEVPAGGGAQTTVTSGLSSPYGVAVDGAGDVFIADTYNSRVVEVPAGGGAQTTVGSGLSYPFAVAVDGAGDVFIADSGNNRVVEVSAGGGGQTIVPASGLNSPSGVVVDGAGDVFIADTNNSRVVEVPAGGGAQTTVGSLYYPYGVAVDRAGDVFIADTDNSRVVQVQRAQPPTLSFASTPVGSISSDSPQSVTIQNIGNQPLNAIDPGLVVGGPNFLQVAGSGTPADCTSTFSLSPGASCNLSISFEPQSIGKLTAAATFIDNALNATVSSQSVALQATATQGSQTIAFGTLSNQTLGTTPFTLSATASSGLAVSFASTTPAVCTVSGATVTLVVAGTCTIQATQTGNVNYGAATPVNQSFQVTGSPGIYAPVNSSTLTGTSAAFQWNAYSGAAAYWLDVGKEQGGNEYYQSGSLPTSTLSETVNSLPIDGSTVWARWYYMLSGTWQHTDYSYTAFGGGAGKGVITSPAPSSTLSGSSVTFNWTAGTGASAYWLDVGNVAGGNQYSQSGNLGNVVTATVNGLPTNGGTVYVTLYSLVGGQWLSNAYSYTAFSGSAGKGVITSPAPSSTLSGSSVTFNWTAGTGASAYWLDVGNVAGGNQYSQSGNLGNVLTTTANGLPTNGSTVYVTLYSLVGGQWLSNAYTYTAFSGSAGKGVITSPIPGSTLSGSSVTFNWTAGTGASAYWLDVGNVAGGNQYSQSGNMGSVLTTTVYSLPADGSTIYATLYSLVGGQWLSNAYTYVSGP
jgi:sugar lactone lactonase YvrE